MNILPKKSWHVRARKNIERVQRDEAEAQLLEAKKYERKLEAEREVRVLELRKRAGIAEPDPAGQHFELFARSDEHVQTRNRDHEDEEKRRLATVQQRQGVWNKLVGPRDASRPWYCAGPSELNPRADKQKTNLKRRADLVTSIYDPMTAINHAEEVVRLRRAEQRQLAISTDYSRRGLQFASASRVPAKRILKDAPKTVSVASSDSDSPEIVGEYKPATSIQKLDTRFKTTKIHKRGSSEHNHKHHRSDEHRSRHKHKKRSKD